MSSNFFKASAYKADITPPIGTLLYGYNPHQESYSIHDRLSVTVLAISQNEKTVLLYTVEIGDINTELTDELRNSLSLKLNIPVEHILISSTHTHSAPNLSGTVGWGELNREYYDSIVYPACEKAAQNALSSLESAEIAVGTIESLVGINRRQQNPDGSIGLGQNPHGCFDKIMTVVSFRSTESKQGIFNLIHYGCHGTSAGVNHEITRDWSGVMIDRLENETGTLTAFWNGAIGDVGPRLTNGETTGNISYTEELGGVAAFDAIRAYNSKGGYHSGNLEVFIDKIKLPYKKIPSLKEVESKLSAYENPESLINIQRLEYEHYKQLKEYSESGNNASPDYLVTNQTIISLGDIVFIPFQYEIFSEISVRLREYSPYPYTLCLSCTNGYGLYLPSEDQLCRGGYEVGCFMYGNLFPLADNTDQNLIDENLRILRENGRM